MINVQNVVQTRAFARQDGAILGAGGIDGSAATMWSLVRGYGLLSLLASILAIGTPFVVVTTLRLQMTCSC